MSVWRGVFPSLPTPYTSGDDLDLAALRAIVRLNVEQGAHGLLCFGLAGEVFRLTPDERKAMTDVIVDAAGGAVPVLVGASAESVHTVRDLARYAATAGASGVVVAPPVTSHLGRAELMRFYVAVADACDVPIMVQDAPEYLGVNLGPELVAELAAASENIVAVKLEIGPDGLREWRSRVGEELILFGGNGGLHIVETIRAGADGLAPGAEVTDILVGIYDALLGGEDDEAMRLYREVLPLLVFELQDIDHFNACAKHVLARRGVPVEPHLRAPAPSLPDSMVPLLDGLVEALGLVTTPST
jgi:4-hydroxy-tetrahydrodipicolinate synthase